MYHNQLAVSADTKNYLKEIENVDKNIQTWVELLDDVNNSLKEIGDIVNYSKKIKNEVNALVHALSLANRGSSNTD